MQTKTLILASALLAVALCARPGFAQTCASDADCTQGMICHSQTSTVCSGGAATPACAANTVCPPTTVEPPTCTDVTTNQCMCPWDVPCNADADFGAGFVCQPMTGGTCSSSGPVTASPGSTGTDTATSGGAASGGGGGSGTGAVPVPPPAAMPDAGPVQDPTCTTTTSYPGTCQPKASTCSVDAECPSQWTCVTQSIGIAVPAPVDGGVNTATPPDRTVSTATATSTIITTRTCQPPSYCSGRAIGTSGGGTGTSGNGDTTQAPTGYDAAADAGVGKGTTAATPPSPTANGGAGTSTDTKTTTSASTGGGGCSVAPGALPSDMIIVLGLGAAIALLARRRNRR